MSILESISNYGFKLVHGKNLVYNTCWEDPRLDRVALELRPSDKVLMITSAGCNALDYALCEPERIHCVDLNPRQNALLELKQSGIRNLDHETFFKMFGEGRLPRCRETYEKKLRRDLSQRSRKYWDKKIRFFAGKKAKRSFYFRGTAGAFARMINFYIDRVVKLRYEIDRLLDAPTVDEQKRLYDQFRDQFWRKFLRWAVGRDMSLSLLGVPRPQRVQVERDYAGGIAKFIEDSVEAVFARLPLTDNYFWRVYLTGQYTHACCPEYLKPENFERLKGGLVDRVETHTTSVLGYLAEHPEPISRFVLLDHMDWLSTSGRPILAQEWQAIVDRASRDARIIWRSGGLRADFVDSIDVQVRGKPRRVGELLSYHKELAAQLHEKDRVHTYGSFYIADLKMDDPA